MRTCFPAGEVTRKHAWAMNSIRTAFAFDGDPSAWLLTVGVKQRIAASSSEPHPNAIGCTVSISKLQSFAGSDGYFEDRRRAVVRQTSLRRHGWQSKGSAGLSWSEARCATGLGRA